MSDKASEALILLGHGTELNSDSAAAVVQHADALRKQGSFAEVHAAFWKQEPRIQDVIESVSSSQVFIVPMFVSAGYFSQEVIPSKLGFEIGPAGAGVQTRGAKTLIYTEPLGTHPGIADIILSRAEEVLNRFPFPLKPTSSETTLFIAGHGTPRSSESRKSVEEQADRIRARGGFAAVHAIFMEEEPFIKDWRALVATRYAVVIPFFIAEGLHVAEDIPVLLGESEALVKERLTKRLPTWRNPTEKGGVLVWYASSVGTSPMLREIILDRVKQARAAVA